MALFLAAVAGRGEGGTRGAVDPPAAAPSRPEVVEALHSFQEAVAARGSRALVEASVRGLEVARRIDPAAAPVALALGQAQRILGSPRNARVYLERAIELEPALAEAYVDLGDTLSDLGRSVEALEAYGRAATLAPGDPRAIERQAHAALRRGEVEVARRGLLAAQAIEAAPSRSALLTLLEGPGWDRTHTVSGDGYRVSTSISDEYAAWVLQGLERIRREYDRLFSRVAGPASPVEVWVHPSREAYRAAGGPEGTLAFYSPPLRLLVLHRGRDAEETAMALQHEAFHAYLHAYLDTAPPWFHEGLADYFATFAPRRGGDGALAPSLHAGRVADAKRALARGRFVPLEDLLLMGREEFQEPLEAPYHYAQSWALIHTIVTVGEPVERAALERCFHEVTRSRDRPRAHAASFGRLDLEGLDRRVRAFVEGL